jgi:hypothetical protein
MHIPAITFLCETYVPFVYPPTGGILCGKKKIEILITCTKASGKKQSTDHSEFP